jgi:hypothetical protein
LVVDWISLKITENHGQVLRHSICLRPLVVLWAELGLGGFLCRRLICRRFFFLAFFLGWLFRNHGLLKFFVLDLVVWNLCDLWLWNQAYDWVNLSDVLLESEKLVHLSQL